MARIRIYELAKELGLENKALLDLCEQAGVGGKSSHSNSLTDEEAQKLRRAVIRSAVSGRANGVREVEREGGMFTEHRIKGNVIRRRKKADEFTDDEPSSDHGHSAMGHEVDHDTFSDELEFIGDISQSDNQESIDSVTDADDDSDAEVIADDTEDGYSMDSDGVASVEVAVDESEQVTDVLVDSDVIDEDNDDVISDAFEDLATETFDSNQSDEVVGHSVEGDRLRSPSDVLAAVRKRHDIRAPKVLGRIDLPERRKVVAKPTSSASVASKASPKSSVAVVDSSVSEDKDRAGKGRSKSKDKGKKDYAIDDFDGDGKRQGLRKRKQIVKKDELLDYDSEREGWRSKREKKQKKQTSAELAAELKAQEGAAGPAKRIVKVSGEISVGELAKNMSIKVGDLIKKLMGLGTLVTINHVLDFETATLMAEEFGFTTVNTQFHEEDIVVDILKDSEDVVLEFRPPVVTVMGHVDHGKTSLLDAIRNTRVTNSEAGGITQHIGAYTVTTSSGGVVAFIDTPGHAAFTEMRSRGAKVTDIVVLVVAADDGVMPQTIEAISHAKAAGVPIIVAINKMDKADANPDRVKQQLADYDLIPEEWGGSTIMVPVSAHTRDGIDLLLENLALQAEILELKANPKRNAVGTVIESRVDRGRGPVMAVLVQSGTLKQGDVFVAGSMFGKVRAMRSHDGKEITEAGPSVPVEVLGVNSVPQAGDDFVVMPSESAARDVALRRGERVRIRELAAKGGVSFGGPLTLNSFAEFASASDVKELNLIVKADVQGSVQAVAQALQQLSNQEVIVRVIHKAVGAITENDVHLASASRAVILAFGVRAEPRALDCAEVEGVDIRYSRIIYELVDMVEKAIKGMKAPVFREKTLGRVEVRETFKVPKIGVIAGSYVLNGTVQRNAQVRLVRDSQVVFEGRMASLRRFKDDVKEVSAGYECGVGIDGYSDIKSGDIIEVFTVETVPVQ